MANPGSLADQVIRSRNELNNLRKTIRGLQVQHKKDVSRLESLLTSNEITTVNGRPKYSQKVQEENIRKLHLCNNWTPIGHIRSWFRTKNGTPRQGSISALTRGILRLDKSIFNNPQHALQGLDQYSHVWIFFVFSKNGGDESGHKKSKVSPPRLDGQRVGVFSTRSPHRPNPLGLTLARLEKVEDDCLYLSGVDILDGTPVLDIKPYILQYDAPPSVVCHIDAPETQASCDDSEKQLPNSQSLSNCHGNMSITEQTEDNEMADNFNNESSSPGSDRHMKTAVMNTEDSPNNFKVDSDYHPSLPKLRNDSERKLDPICHFIGINEDSVNSHQHFTAIDDFQNPLMLEDSSNDCENKEEPSVKTASWVKCPPLTPLRVCFNPIAESQISFFSSTAKDVCYRLEFLCDGEELKCAISGLLRQDPRSTYRRQKCSSLLYHFTVDTAHITTWFEDDLVEVLRVRPLHIPTTT